MDTSDIEQKRGITIFASEAYFNYKEDTYYIIDTPGHIDFSAETERAVSALDYAILLISASSGVQAHTLTLFRLLKEYDIPTFIFINKTDIDGFDLQAVMNEIKVRLTKDVIYLGSPEDIVNE